MKRLLLLLLVYPLTSSKLPTPPAIVTVTVTESIAYAGVSSTIEIWVDVKDGYHIQANKVNDESLIPTTLEVTGNGPITITNQEFPLSKQFRLEGTENYLDVYDGKFPIKLFLKPDVKTKAGSYVLNGTLRYQACDSRSCLFPRVIEFSIPVEIKP